MKVITYGNSNKAGTVYLCDDATFENLNGTEPYLRIVYNDCVTYIPTRELTMWIFEKGETE